MFTIRPATNDDAPFLPEIERRSGAIFRHWPGLEWIADDQVQSEHQHLALIADGLALVAEVPGFGLAGFLNGEVSADALHIWQMAVDHDQQGQGIGRALIAAARQAAVDRGIAALTLTTFREVSWNEPYYQRLGFVTLADEELSPRLKAVLSSEAQAGLPMTQRCAMRCRL